MTPPPAPSPPPDPGSRSSPEPGDCLQDLGKADWALIGSGRLTLNNPQAGCAPLAARAGWRRGWRGGQSQAAAPSRAEASRPSAPRKARGNRSRVIRARKRGSGPKARSCSLPGAGGRARGGPRRPGPVSSAPQEPSLRVRRRGPRGLVGSAPGFGVLAPPFGHLCDLAMHTVLCQPGRPPPCSHFPQAWAFLFPTGIFPLSVQLSKPAPGDAPPKKRGGGKALHPTFPAPDKAPSFQLSAIPAGRQRQRPGAGGSWGRGRRS